MELFEENPEEVEQLYAKRAEQGGLGFSDQAALRTATDAMLTDLKKRIRDVLSSDHMASKRFLESLAFVGLSCLPLRMGGLHSVKWASGQSPR